MNEGKRLYINHRAITLDKIIISFFVYLFFIEPNNADELPKKTVAETVQYAAKYLVNLNGQSSLIMLKKYLTSECGEIYVTRHTERIKSEVKEMFKNDVIYPAHRSKTSRAPSVSVQFKFRAAKVKARRVSLAQKKMVQKKAKAAASKKK